MVAQIDEAYKKLPKQRVIKRLVSYLMFEGRPLTTKGRFINPFLLAFYSLCTKLPSKRLEKTPVFILGTGRSGTTILGLSLSAHKDIGFLNEPKLPWYFANSNDDIIGSYTNLAGCYFLDAVDASEKVVERISSIYQTYQYFTASKVIVDKYPEMIFRTGYTESVFPNSKYIFLIRNGVDIVRSITYWSERKAVIDKQEVHDWWGKDDRKWKLLVQQVATRDAYFNELVPFLLNCKEHVTRAAVEWMLTMKQGLSLLERSELDVYPLRYEDYVDNQRTRNSLLNFIGLTGDYHYENYCAQSLKAPSKTNTTVKLPSVLIEPFNQLQEKLGYSDYAG